jgi:hypothetical protein
MSHANVLVAALVVGCVSLASRAGAAEPQATEQPASSRQIGQNASSGVFWLTGYRFHLSAVSVRSDDPRFRWDAHFGGDVDLLDYRIGRINFLADYEVMIGSEFRSIDPNQGAYHLDLSTSVRSGPTEVQAVYDHVSRHLSDRANRTSVSWNSAGAVVTTRYGGRAMTATFDVRGAKVLRAAFVDYTWQLGAGVDVEYRLSRHQALVARGDLEPILVDRRVAGRDAQVGARIEGGMRLYGTGAGVEVFAAWERRVDPYPLERATRSWALLGFRFVNR